MNGQRVNRRLKRRSQFRSPIGLPLYVEIYVEEDQFGEIEILRSYEIDRSSGVRILSQSEVDQEEVLMLYRVWRRRPENQDRIQRINLDSMFNEYQNLSNI